MSAASEIKIKEFRELLNKYPELIRRIAQPPKAGKPGLEELDQFRFIDAPSRLSKKAGAKFIELDDMKKLLEWKIRHGKFRPTLPKLLASNSDSFAHEVSTVAFETYAQDSDAIKAVIKKLSELKGVGPATASLLLAVHDPENVIFFSDEAFQWLCPSKASKITYVVTEYEELTDAAKLLMNRLKVSPIEIEKVAFVIGREPKPKDPNARPRGRPSLVASKMSPEEETNPAAQEKAPVRKIPAGARGRPKKVVTPKTAVPDIPKPESRPRGRPSKVETPKVEPPKVEARGRGRPPKRKVEEEVAEVPKKGKRAKA